MFGANHNVFFKKTVGSPIHQTPTTSQHCLKDMSNSAAFWIDIFDEIESFAKRVKSKLASHVGDKRSLAAGYDSAGLLFFCLPVR